MTTSAYSRIFVVGRHAVDALEGSYVRAFRHLGLTVTAWDMPAAIRRHTKAGRLGAAVNSFWPSEPWTAKANRDLLVSVFDARPDIVIVGGASRVTAGALSQIRATLPQCKLVLVWPDPLLYCFSAIIQCLPAYDLVATYSRATVEPFRRLGARRASWVPLGFDPELHPPDVQLDDNTRLYQDCDASFIGDYTPEREQLVSKLVKSGLRVKVWGPVAWRKSVQDRATFARYWQGGPLFANDFSRAVRCAPVSLNPINIITFPTANMRFFEILGCGGVPVSASCPEMEDLFPHGEACFYYGDGRDVVDVVRSVQSNEEASRSVARAGQTRVLAAHTYAHRAQQILDLLSQAENGTPAGQVRAK